MIDALPAVLLLRVCHLHPPRSPLRSQVGIEAGTHGWSYQGFVQNQICGISNGLFATSFVGVCSLSRFQRTHSMSPFQHISYLHHRSACLSTVCSRPCAMSARACRLPVGGSCSQVPEAFLTGTRPNHPRVFLGDFSLRRYYGLKKMPLDPTFAAAVHGGNQSVILVLG